MRHHLQLAAIFALLTITATASAQRLPPGCGSLQNAYGPFDYTNPSHFREKLPRVEQHHFDGGVEALRGHAQHPQNLAGDIDYTLRAFPNHHRALYAMARYQLEASKRQYKRKPMRYSAPCYFERAMAFSPGDGTVRMIYGVYLFKANKYDESAQRFEEALERSPDDPEVHYNLGLVLVKSKKYDGALKHAKIAYELGHPMPGLRKQLESAGVWE